MFNQAELHKCKEFDAQIWSDLHKDAYGFRPRQDMSNWTAEALDELWRLTFADLEDSIDRETTMEIESELAFDSKLDDLVRLGAGNRAAAFRWLLDAEGIDVREDMGYFCYSYGLPYSMAPELQALARA